MKAQRLFLKQGNPWFGQKIDFSWLIVSMGHVAVR
jgi:hypothetical protein